MGLRRVFADARRQPVEGVQFHPESFLTLEGPKLLANFLAMGPRPRATPGLSALLEQMREVAPRSKATRHSSVSLVGVIVGVIVHRGAASGLRNVRRSCAAASASRRRFFWSRVRPD